MIMPSGARRSDGAFYTAVANSLRLTNADRLTPQKGKERLVNFIKTRCGQAQQTLMVMFIDNAQRITRAEYDYLADIDEQITDAKLRLFVVFMRQSDASGVEVADDWSDYPSHMLRRWFMGSHPFLPLTGLDEVTHALDRFDGSAFWPTPDMPFTRYFARAAFDDGWRLASQAALIVDVVNAIRSQANLPPSNAWPMATFTGTVRYLLANVAAKVPGFREFTTEQIADALSVSGYLRLEYVRANLLMREAVA
ncbi:ATP-binding protein [Rhodanobacter glycinis]|nr:ATP-binding protein [Rhodanobacter glycinis]